MPTELTKRQQRAITDAKCAWRAMADEQREELLGWIESGCGDTDLMLINVNEIVNRWEEPVN